MIKQSIFINILYFALTVIVISAPALFNGYPILYLDSHRYISQSVTLEAAKTSPIGYGLFIRAFSWQASLWPVVFAQGLLISLLLYFTLRSLKFFQNLHIVHFAVIIILTVFTSMGYISSTIMADIFAPVLILSAYLLFARNTPISIRVFAFVCTVFSGLSHFSTQLEIITLFLVLLVFYKLLKSYSFKQYLLRGFVLVLAFVLALVINYSFYYSKYHGDNQGSVRHVIIMGRLVETGILDEYLEYNCEDSRYSLCDYKGKFPRRLTQFVWDNDSPFHQTGGWNHSKEEYTEIIYNVFSSPYYLGMFAYKGFISGLRELVSFKTGIIKVEPDMSINKSISNHFSHEYKEFQQAKQRFSANVLTYTNMAYYILSALSLLLVLSLILKKKKLDTNLNNLILILLFGIFFNAMITGAVAGVVQRFQARVNWLLVFLGLIIAFMYIKQLVNYLKSLDLPVKDTNEDKQP